MCSGPGMPPMSLYRNAKFGHYGYKHRIRPVTHVGPNRVFDSGYGSVHGYKSGWMMIWRRGTAVLKRRAGCGEHGMAPYSSGYDWPVLLHSVPGLHTRSLRSLRLVELRSTESASGPAWNCRLVSLRATRPIRGTVGTVRYLRRFRR